MTNLIPVNVTIDTHPSFPPLDLIETCGLPLFWAFEWFSLKNPSEPLTNFLLSKYQFPCPNLPDAFLSPDGALLYPGDPDLPYLIKVCVPQQRPVYYQYPYALIAVEEESSLFTGRMD